MSGKITGEVLDRCLALKGVQKLLLISLADYCGAERDCWPSMKTIAKRSGCTERYARQVVSELEKLGYISIRPNQGPRRVNVYVLSPAETWDTLGLGDTEPQDTPEAQFPIGGNPSSGIPRNPSSANPSSDPSTEPSSSSAVAEEPPTKPKRQRSAKQQEEDAASKTLEDEFTALTGIRIEGDARSSAWARVRWWNPLRNMAKQCEWNLPLAVGILRCVVYDMRQRRLPVSAPQSVEKMFTAERGLRRVAQEQAPAVASSSGKPWWADGGSMRLPVQTQHGRGNDD